MSELQHLGLENMSGSQGCQWKVGFAKPLTNCSRVIYMYTCSFSNVQPGCLFCSRTSGLSLSVELSAPTRTALYTDGMWTSSLGMRSIKTMSHTLSLLTISHINHNTAPKLDQPTWQGPPLLWITACQDNPLCLRFTQSKIVTWLHNNKLLLSGLADESLLHECKK